MSPHDVASLVAAIHEWVEKHAEKESAFLSPDGAWTVDAKELLDFVYETTGLTAPQRKD